MKLLIMSEFSAGAMARCPQSALRVMEALVLHVLHFFAWLQEPSYLVAAHSFRKLVARPMGGIFCRPLYILVP